MSSTYNSIYLDIAEAICESERNSNHFKIARSGFPSTAVLTALFCSCMGASLAASKRMRFMAGGQERGEDCSCPEIITASAVIKLHLVFRASLNTRYYANIHTCKFRYLIDM